MRSFRRFGYFAALVVCAAATALGASSCASAPREAGTAPEEHPAKRIRAALYLDRGSSGNGVFHWARLLEYSPQIELRGVDGQDIRDGKLSDFDLLVMPGGLSPAQYKSLREDGAEKVREFIRNGGSYVGTCAGLACTLNDKDRLKLLPFTRKPRSGGKQAILAVDFSEAGAKVLGIAPGRYYTRYSGGPIPVPGREMPDARGEVLAVYKNTVSYYDKPEGNFFGEAAVIYGTLGKGRVIATGFHPEYWESTHPIVAGCVYAVTGVRPTFEFPVDKPHALRVGFWCSGTPDARRLADMLEIDRDPGLDMVLVSAHQVNLGILRHLDVLVVAHDKFGTCRKHLGAAFVRGQVQAFLERGGRVIVSGNGAECVPKHRNVIEVPMGASLAEAALECIRK